MATFFIYSNFSIWTTNEFEPQKNIKSSAADYCTNNLAGY